jgi:hypothetical protein
MKAHLRFSVDVIFSKVFLPCIVCLLGLLVSTSTLNAQVYVHAQVYFEQNDPIFKILYPEMRLSNIPVCAFTYWSSTSNRDKSESALTDSTGTAKLKISAEEGTSLAVFVNGGETKTEFCGSSASKNLRAEYRGTGQTIETQRVLEALWKHVIIAVGIQLRYDGIILETQNAINELLSQVPSMPCDEINGQLEKLLGQNSTFGASYPLSSKAIKTQFLETVEGTKQKLAEEAFKKKQYELALRLYSDLVNNFAASPSLTNCTERKNSCEFSIKKKSDCDSLMSKASLIADKSQAIRFLETSLAQISDSDPCRNTVQDKMQELQTGVESQKDEAEFARLKSQDEKALKKFNVDLTVTQLDFFSNPFAFKGKCLALTCIVKKFETPTSAIMEAANSFYADFKVATPKKFTTLNLIVKVKGVTTLINAFGAPMKVPRVDVVHILNNSPSNY